LERGEVIATMDVWTAFIAAFRHLLSLEEVSFESVFAKNGFVDVGMKQILNQVGSHLSAVKVLHINLVVY